MVRKPQRRKAESWRSRMSRPGLGAAALTSLAAADARESVIELFFRPLEACWAQPDLLAVYDDHPYIAMQRSMFEAVEQAVAEPESGEEEKSNESGIAKVGSTRERQRPMQVAERPKGAKRQARRRLACDTQAAVGALERVTRPETRPLVSYLLAEVNGCRPEAEREGVSFVEACLAHHERFAELLRAVVEEPTDAAGKEVVVEAEA